MAEYVRLGDCNKGDRIRAYVVKFASEMEGVITGRTQQRKRVLWDNGYTYSLDKNTLVERIEEWSEPCESLENPMTNIDPGEGAVPVTAASVIEKAGGEFGKWWYRTSWYDFIKHHKDGEAILEFGQQSWQAATSQENRMPTESEMREMHDRFVECFKDDHMGNTPGSWSAWLRACRWMSERGKA